MPTTAGSGTQTAVVGTEHTLFDSAASGTYLFSVDAVNMAAGDLLELRCYKMVLTAGTRRVLYMVRYLDAQMTDDLIKVSEPVSVDITDAGAFRATLKQTQGTGRVFPWSVVAL